MIYSQDHTGANYHFYGNHRASQVVLVVKNPPANAGDVREVGSVLRLGRSPWRRKWQPTPVFLPGKSHGQKSLVGYSLWGCKQSDMTERMSAHTHTHTQLGYILQSMQENHCF